MSFYRSKACALLLVFALTPGAVEILENAAHLLTEGHLAHAASHDDPHEPTGPEHGCTPVFHFCGCHAGLAFVGQRFSSKTLFLASLLEEPFEPGSPSSSFWPSIDRPPRS